MASKPKPSKSASRKKTPKTRKLPKQVLVTGASGFIGSHVVKRLVQEGVKVRCLVLPQDKAPSLREVDYERFDGDLSDIEALAEAMADCEMVFHLAAIYAIWLPKPEVMYEVNVEGTVNVMLAAKKAGVTRVIHTSSIAAIGNIPGRGISDETTQFNSWEVANEYIMSKYISEIEALSHNGPELEVVAVNPAFPFGANDRAPTPTGKMVADSIAGKVPFIVDGGINAVYVGDVAEGHLLAAQKGVPGQRYILGGHNVTFKQISAIIYGQLGKKPPRMELPTSVAKAWGWMNERWANNVSHSPPMATYKAVSYTTGRFVWFSNDKARRDLGFTVTPLEEALRISVEWFQKYPV